MYNIHSHECGEQEKKARERKEELESQVKEHETVVAQLSGTFLASINGTVPINNRAIFSIQLKRRRNLKHRKRTTSNKF